MVTKRGEPLARITPVRRARKGESVRLPLLKGKGRRGLACPDTETPYDLVFD
jgi:antitoxin (DNA-binding transcriptional repressor) of toxin-antitoxin stability system